MATVNFLYRSTKDKGVLTIRLLFRHNNIDFVIGSKTKLIVTDEYWNKLHNKSTKDAELKTKQVETNNELNKIENYILDHFNKAKTDSVNKKWLENHISNYYDPPKKGDDLPTELTRYFDFYINYREHDMKQTSVQKFKVIKNKLEELQTARRKPILIKDVNDSFKKEFVNFYKTNNYAQNTIQRELTFVKTVCRHARFLGLETSPQLDSLQIDKEKVEKLYLSFDELNSIENINEELSASLQNARDWLIISCYTGQRVSDFMKFNESQIRIENGKSLIEFTQKKTGKIMTVPLHKKVLDILAKRGGKFPYSISDQRYNEFIKIVCEKAKITQLVSGGKQTETAPKSKIFRKERKMYKKYELVTSHIGRRSFATNFYGIIPTSLLISATGHSTEVMFLNYIGKTDTQKAKQLADYF